MCIHDCLGCVCVCVRACTCQFGPGKMPCVYVCALVSAFEYDQHVGKRVLDHVLRTRVPNNIYGADFLCIFLLTAAGRAV
jgi:hypothetical protein